MRAACDFQHGNVEFTGISTKRQPLSANPRTRQSVTKADG